MSQGLPGGDSLLRVEMKHFLNEIPGLGLDLRQYLSDVPGSVVGKVRPQNIRVLGPVLLSRGAQQSHDPRQLVALVQSGEQRLPAHQLGKDAATGPNVYRGGVGCPQQDLGSSVPEGHHLIKNICGIKLLIMIKCYRGPPDFIGWILSIKKS